MITLKEQTTLNSSPSSLAIQPVKAPQDRHWINMFPACPSNAPSTARHLDLRCCSRTVGGGVNSSLWHCTPCFHARQTFCSQEAHIIPLNGPGWWIKLYTFCEWQPYKIVLVMLPSAPPTMPALYDPLSSSPAYALTTSYTLPVHRQCPWELTPKATDLKMPSQAITPLWCLQEISQLKMAWGRKTQGSFILFINFFF